MRKLFLFVSLLFSISSLSQGVPNYVPTDSLVGWWPFSGNATDVSGNGLNGTVYGASLTTDRHGNSNNAYDFNGNSYIEVANNPTLNFSSSHSYSVWVRITGTNTYQHFITRNDGNSHPLLQQFYLRKSGGAIELQNSPNGNIVHTTNTLSSSNPQWHHIAAVVDVNALMSFLYLDGVKIDSSNLAMPLNYNTNNGKLWIGVEHPSVSLPSGPQYLQGKLDDIGIWNRALTQCEISNLYNSNVGSCAVGANTDTTICQGDTITLGTSYLPSPICTNGIGEWEQIFSSTDLNGYTITRNSSYSFDTVSGVYYSVSNGAITALDLVNKTINTVTSTGGSSSISNAVYNYSDSKLYGHRVGRDVVYSISTSGGAWSSVGSGSFDGNSYSSLDFYNSHDERIGFFGGYGFYAVKNWVYESTASGWINSFANNSNCNSTSVPSKRNAGGIAPNKDFKKMYLFSGMGNCSGSQTATTCTLGNAWATDVGVYCWLKDLWEYDFVTDQFTNILSYNNSSIPLEGEFTYDYDRDIFYLLGGWTPSPTYQSGYGNTALNSNMVFRYDRGNNSGGFDTVSICGTPPPIGAINSTSGIAIYDSPRDRIIWLRADGVWAINLSNSTSPNSLAYLWSTGDTKSTINVSPAATTNYWVKKISGNDTIVDTITVNVLDPNINASTSSVCNPGDSVMLWVSKDSSLVQSCGGLPSSLYSGLMAYFPFCGNANDISGYGNNGTVLNAVLCDDRNNNPQSAYYFDGTSKISVPSSASISDSLSNEATFSVWINIDSYPNGYGPILSKNGPSTRQFEVWTESNKLGFWSTNIYDHAVTNVPFNNWLHYVVTFDSGVLKYYLNSTLVQTTNTTTTSLVGNNSIFEIGYDSPGLLELFKGEIDDIGIWSRALSPSEITQLFNASTNYSSTLWSTGETTDTIWINPTTDTTIWVSSSLGNVTCIDSIDIEFLNPQIQSNRMGVCAPGDTAMLWVENESNAITWSTGETSDTIYVTPTVATSYWVQFTSFSGICSDTIEIDVSQPIEIFGDSLACAGDSILLYTIPSQTVSNQEIPDSLMYQVTKTFGQNWQVDWAISPNDWYLLEVSGLWNFTSCSNHRDPAYWTSVSCLSSNLQMTPYTLNCAGGNASWWIADSCNQRPINDIYSTNHTYTYKVRASDGNLTLKFYDDQHSDNGGALSFKLYSIKDSSVTTENPVNWSTGETTDSIWVKPTQTTTYWVSGTDQYGCLSTDSITVFVSDIQNSISTQEPSCNGSSDGQAQVNPTGGVSPYTFLWSNGSGSSIANNLSSDTVWVAVTDSIGCSAIDTFFLDQPDSLLITSILTSSYNGFNVSCNGGSDGNVNTTVAGGTMPYYYNWNNNTYTTSDISNAVAGTYILQVTDTNGCIVNSTIVLTEPNPIIISPSITSNYNSYAISCYGESDGSAGVNISGGIAPYSILWSNGVPTASITNVPSGSYSVIITDDNGCLDSSQIYLSQPNPLTATALVTDASCYGGENGRIELSLSGGAGSININWNTGDTGTALDNIPSGWYSYNVTSSNNCTYEDSIFLNHPMPLSIELDTIHPTCINSFDGELNIVAMGGTPGYNYFLNGNGFTGSIQGLGTDSLRILAVDFNNCDTVFVIAMPPVRDPCIFIPNWFSPNGNSEEDTWLIDGFEYGELTLKIFNVFGQELYRTESTNYTPWDGTFNGKSLPAGDYYYVITSALLNNNYTGYVTILR